MSKFHNLSFYCLFLKCYTHIQVHIFFFQMCVCVCVCVCIYIYIYVPETQEISKPVDDFYKNLFEPKLMTSDRKQVLKCFWEWPFVVSVRHLELRKIPWRCKKVHIYSYVYEHFSLLWFFFFSFCLPYLGDHSIVVHKDIFPFFRLV